MSPTLPVETFATAEPVPEHLPGEPRREHPPAPIFALRFALQAVIICVIGLITVPLWPIFLLAAAIGGWPPNVVRPRQAIRYTRLIRRAEPPPSGPSLIARNWLALLVVRRVALAPVHGLAWLLDELIDGRALDAVRIEAPLFEISAARSGSTQLARYLEDDPHLVAPTLLQSVMPYRWLWRLAGATIGRLISIEAASAKVEARMPPEFMQRHEGHLGRTDTFEGALYLLHLNHLSPFLGREAFATEFALAVPAPHNRALWEEIFPDLLDRIGRKVLLHAGPAPDGRPRRLFVKGHFLAAADALARRYPDARFVTLIRDPVPRLRSMVNFLRANPLDRVLGAPPFNAIGPALAAREVVYCEAEMAWYRRPEGPIRCVIRFDDYVKDLEGTLTRIYRECLDCDALPAHAPREHTPRKRTDYLLNRTLAEAGVDEAAFTARVADYRTWARGEVT